MSGHKSKRLGEVPRLQDDRLRTKLREGRDKSVSRHCMTVDQKKLHEANQSSREIDKRSE